MHNEKKRKRGEEHDTTTHVINNSRFFPHKSRVDNNGQPKSDSMAALTAPRSESAQ